MTQGATSYRGRNLFDPRTTVKLNLADSSNRLGSALIEQSLKLSGVWQSHTSSHRVTQVAPRAAALTAVSWRTHASMRTFPVVAHVPPHK
jgi:hypothetical protein